MSVKKLSGGLLVAEADGTPVGTVGSLVLPNDSVSLVGSVATVRAVPTGFIGAQAVRTTTQALTGGGEAVISFTDADAFDTDGFHDPSSSSSHVTVPAGLGGKYKLIANVVVATGSGQYRYVQFKKNGTTLGTPLLEWLGGASFSNGHMLEHVLELAAGDYVEVLVGTADSVNLSSATFTVYKLDSGKVGQGIGCGLTNSVDIGLTSGSEGALNLDTDLWDTDGFHDVGTNTNRITIPAGLGGKYILTIHGRFTGNPGRSYLIGRRQTANQISLMAPTINNGTDFVAVGSTVLDLAAGDYIEFKYLTSNNTNLEATTVDYGPIVTFMRIDSGSNAPAYAHGFKIIRDTSNQNIGNVTFTAVQWNNETFDPDNGHDNSTNNTRYTIPTIPGVTTGLWRFTTNGYTDATSGRADAKLRKAGTTDFDVQPGWAIPNSGVNPFFGTWLVVLSAGEYVEVLVRTTGGNFNVVATDGSAQPRFEGEFLGKVT